VLQIAMPIDDPAEKGKKKRRFGKKGIVYAMYLDVASRIMFPVVFILFIIIYWGYYINANDNDEER
jgi:hypothetical protein